MEKQTTGLIGIIFGVLGFFIFGIPFGIIAVILGATSLDETSGKCSLVLGIIDIVGVLILIALI